MCRLPVGERRRSRPGDLLKTLYSLKEQLQARCIRGCHANVKPSKKLTKGLETFHEYGSAR